MKIKRSWWYIDANGMPTLGRTHWRAKCLSLEWGTKVTVFWVGEVVPVKPCGCTDGACSKCYSGPVTTL